MIIELTSQDPEAGSEIVHGNHKPGRRMQTINRTHPQRDQAEENLISAQLSLLLKASTRRGQRATCPFVPQTPRKTQESKGQVSLKVKVNEKAEEESPSVCLKGSQVPALPHPGRKPGVSLWRKRPRAAPGLEMPGPAGKEVRPGWKGEGAKL